MVSDDTTDQWRIDNARHLSGLTLRYRPYTRWSEAWDHDHCAACGAKFTDSGDEAGSFHEGYATGPDYPKGAGYEWVCPTCFTELAAKLGWTAVTE